MRLLLCTVLTGLVAWLPAPADASVLPGPAREGAWPLLPRPEVVSGFDPPASPWGAGHRGVDLGGQSGQTVRTALAGTVTFAARLAGRGVVVVDHGGVRTTYEPVDASVRVGDRLARGSRIGTLRRSSSHCFPRACLHWGLVRGRTYLDPLTLVGAGPVRLLPLAARDLAGPGFLATALLPTAPTAVVTRQDRGPVGSGPRVRPWGGRGGMPGAAGPK
jgi:hypothetical protein